MTPNRKKINLTQRCFQPGTFFLKSDSSEVRVSRAFASDCICKITRWLRTRFVRSLNTVYKISSNEKKYLRKNISAEPGFDPGVAG